VHTINRNVLFELEVINVFESIKDFFPMLTLVEVVVLVHHMDDKLKAIRAWRGAFGDSLDGCDTNLPLNAACTFNIIQICIGEKQSSFLSHHPSIDLNDLAREQYFLPDHGSQLEHKVLIICTVLHVLNVKELIGIHI
jgi:hypothetical protein